MISEGATERLRMYHELGAIVIFNDYSRFLQELLKSYDRHGYIISGEKSVRDDYFNRRVCKDCNTIHQRQMTGYLRTGQSIRVMSDEADPILSLSTKDMVVLVV